MNTDFLHEKSFRLDAVMPLIREQLASGRNVQFKPKGTSMRPMLRQGIDSVILSPLPQGKLKKYDLPLYQRDNGQYVLHRIVEVGDTYTCIGDNQYEYEYGVRHDQMIGVVTGFYRGEDYYSVTQLSHRVYRCLWHHSRTLRPKLRRMHKVVRNVIKGKN